MAALRRNGADMSRRLRCGAAMMQGAPAQLATPSSTVGSFEPEGARHASLQAVKTRMNSVENIAKITKAMKMVAASRLRGVQDKTEISRGFPQPIVRVMGDFPAAAADKMMLVPITSDKGLCGGINSTIAKYSRVFSEMNPTWSGDQTMFVIGEKGRAQMMRGATKELINNIILDTGKNMTTFAAASAVAEEVLKQTQGEGNGKTQLFFNKFASAIAFKPTLYTILSPEQQEKHHEGTSGAVLDDYELEGPIKSELMQDLYEFQMGSCMYHAMLESSCSELGSRMQAMENSTKNAGEMLDKLTLYYNRTRQAKITTELIEIISGAEALSQA